jgi:hypothetical protein
MDPTTKSLMKSMMILGECRALILQMYARGGYQYGGTTAGQVEYLTRRIAELRQEVEQ